MESDSPVVNVAGWPVVSLREVTTKIGSGATPRGGAESYLAARSKFALIRSQNVFDRRFDESGLAFITDGQSNDLRGVWLQPGDVLLNITGDGVTFGRSCLVPEHVLPACVNQHVSIIRADRGRAVPGYLLAFLTHPDVKPYIASFNSGGSRRAVTKGHIESFRLPLPPMEMQRRIAATLGALDDKIESNRRAQALIEQVVQARFQAAFSVDDEPGGEAISSIVEVNPRRTLGRGQLATYVGMSSLPEHAAEVTDWDVKEFGSGQKFANGDVLMARITPCLENGKTAVVDMLPNDEVGWGSTEYLVLAPRGAVSTPWVYCLARSEPVRAYAIRSMSGTSGRQRFQPDGFDKYRIPAPDIAVLRAFNAQAIPLFQRMTSLRDENRALARVRDTLLPELLSGRIRVPEAREAVVAAVG